MKLNKIAATFALLASTSALAADPQFIMLTMDDGVSQEMEAAIANVDNSVPWTFYVNVVAQSGGWNYNESLLDIDCIADANQSACVTKPDSIKRLHEKGHEMALHTYSHPALAGGEKPLTEDQIFREIQKNYEFLVAAGVPPEDIKGFRAPFLDTQSAGVDDNPKKNEGLRRLQAAFNHFNIAYDSTFTAQIDQADVKQGTRHCSKEEGTWTYARCNFENQDQFNWDESKGGYPSYDAETYPASSHIQMANLYWDDKQLNAMDSVFGLCNGACSPETVKNIWMSNFLAHYNSEEKTPFGIFLHRQSLSKPSEVEGLNLFIAEVKANYPDAKFATSTEVHEYYAGNGEIPASVSISGNTAINWGETTTLTAKADNVGEAAVEYNWTQISGDTSVTLTTNAMTGTAIVDSSSMADASATLGFQVDVIDTKTGTVLATNQTTVSVKGTQVEATEGSVTISGATSVDWGKDINLVANASITPVDAVITYEWTQTSGDSVNFDANTSALTASTANLVNATQALSFRVAIKDEAGTVIDTDSVTVSINEEQVGGTDYPQYAEGTQYQAGDRVTNNGDAFECKPWPYSDWCSGAAHSYEPGVGTSWEAAWDQL
ncbi:polysaccharide deacetylase family protein [Vibrio sp.]|nr:polysaccharide deacetylase family protein [Vibrio sp.]